MEDRIQAKFEITELISRYGNCLDAGDFDGLEALFAPDAVFRIVPENGTPPLEGSRGIRGAIERRWTLVHGGAQHRDSLPDGPRVMPEKSGGHDVGFEAPDESTFVQEGADVPAILAFCRRLLTSQT